PAPSRWTRAACATNAKPTRGWAMRFSSACCRCWYSACRRCGCRCWTSMDAAADLPAMADAMVPRIVRVRKRTRDLPGTVTLDLEPADEAPLPRYRPGQFTMLYAFGVGEIPVSISGDASDASRLVQTIRSVGAVSDALTALQPGDVLGLRGPFGTAWPTEDLAGQDVVVVAGGLGLAPLRPSIYHLLANRSRFGKVVLLYGTRSPDEILYRRQLETWRQR